jgi:hypothetical protein
MYEEAKKLGMKSAYPFEYEDYNHVELLCKRQEFGLTKREYFAGLFMQALIANPERYKYIAERVQNGMPQKEASEKNAHKAVLLADALLEELVKSEH